MALCRKHIRSIGDSGNKIYFLLLSWKMAIVSEEQIGAIKGREGGIEGDRGGETRWREERQVSRASTSLLLYYYQECSTAVGQERESCNLGSKHDSLSSIIQPAGGGAEDGGGRTEVAFLRPPPCESVGPPPSLTPCPAGGGRGHPVHEP